MSPKDEKKPRTDEATTPGEPEVSTPDHKPPTTTGPNIPAAPDDSLDPEDIVAVLAALIPGLGQMFLGQTVKGLVLLGVAILTGCIGGVLSVASLVDAFLVAKAKKRRPVDEWEFFPEFKRTFDL